MDVKTWVQPMENVFKAINRLVEEFKDIVIIFPMHKNPKVRELAKVYIN